MKHFILTTAGILILVFIQSMVFGQDKLVKDLDNDKIQDTVFIDVNSSRIVCRLSTQNFKKIQSRVIEILNDESGITLTRNGFAFYNNWMRAGYRNQFRYEPKSKRIRLIGMSRYEFGNVANDGSGGSSVNLLTGDYVGNWNFYDEDKQELISIPTIRAKMHLPVTYLEFFNDETYFNYAGKCAALYEQHKSTAKL